MFNTAEVNAQDANNYSVSRSNELRDESLKD
jgi:hypothetical protein